MSKRGDGNTPVLTWRRGTGEPTGLWERVESLGWLPDSPRFVLQVGRCDGYPLSSRSSAPCCRRVETVYGKATR